MASDRLQAFWALPSVEGGTLRPLWYLLPRGHSGGRKVRAKAGPELGPGWHQGGCPVGLMLGPLLTWWQEAGRLPRAPPALAPGQQLQTPPWWWHQLLGLPGRCSNSALPHCAALDKPPEPQPLFPQVHPGLLLSTSSAAPRGLSSRCAPSSLSPGCFSPSLSGGRSPREARPE